MLKKMETSLEFYDDGYEPFKNLMKSSLPRFDWVMFILSDQLSDGNRFYRCTIRKKKGIKSILFKKYSFDLRIVEVNPWEEKELVDRNFKSFQDAWDFVVYNTLLGKVRLEEIITDRLSDGNHRESKYWPIDHLTEELYFDFGEGEK